MFTYIEWLAHLEHHKDLLREAEQDRLARLAISAHPVRKVKKNTVIDESSNSKPTIVACCASSTA